MRAIIVASMWIPEADAYRLGQLTERLALLRLQAREIAAEQRAILARYGISDANVTVVTEPGGPYPVGTVLDGKTGEMMVARSLVSSKESENGQAEGT
jgi:hypothetical protein